MKKMNEKKIQKHLLKVKSKHQFIPEYAENYSLINTGNHEDFNNYDLTLKDEQGNQLVLRKTVHGDQTAELLFLLKTPNARYVNEKRVYNIHEVPAEVYCMKSEKEWRFSFKGNMIKTSDINKETTYIELKAIFKSEEPIKDLFEHINYQTSAKKLTKHQVDQMMLKNPNLENLVSYEQKGIVEAEINFNQDVLKLNSAAVRKHNFGKVSLQSLFKYMNVAQ